MAQNEQNTNRKKRDRIGVILYLLYTLVLILGVIVVGRIIYIQCFWKLDKRIVKYFVPPVVKSTIAQDRGAIIGCNGELLAMSTPMYELRMDCTVRKDYFKEKMRKKPTGKNLEQEWLDKAKAFSEGISKELDMNAPAVYKSITDGRRNGNKYKQPCII